MRGTQCGKPVQPMFFAGYLCAQCGRHSNDAAELCYPVPKKDEAK